VAIAAALVVNSLLGQLAMGVVTHPFSETVVNQTIGLEAVSLFLVLWSLGTVQFAHSPRAARIRLLSENHDLGRCLPAEVAYARTRCR